MDAQELPQVDATISPVPGAGATQAPGPESSESCLGHCTPAQCNASCALHVIDGLLSSPTAVSPPEADYLLDLRQLLRARENAEAALRTFCTLRCTLESRQYLAFYRLRRWFENQIKVTVISGINQASWELPLKLDRFCLEAVRRRCLCDALSQGFLLGAARLSFSFTNPQR